MRALTLAKLYLWVMVTTITSCSQSNSSPPLPVSVGNLQSQVGDGLIILSWDKVSNASSYNVYWSESIGVSKQSGQKIINVTSPLRHTGLVNSTRYYHIVTPVNDQGEGPESEVVITTPIGGTGSFDPLFKDQWHLQNTGQEEGIEHEDINIIPVWNQGLRGEGIRIAIIDEDLELSHEDIKTNIATGLSHNYMTGDNNPECPDTSVQCGHGTAVSGLIAARDLNDKGIRGAAPRANLVGYNLLLSRLLSNEADAMIRNAANVHISNNSWGAADNADLHAAPQLWRDAISTGLETGRGGKGIVYVWAAGNGALANDNSNYDGYANNRGVIAVCAVDDRGIRSTYSESGANLRLCAPSQGMPTSGHGISTIDRTGPAGLNRNGNNNYDDTNYSKRFTGTSASAPITSGIIALILQANNLLGWRDIQWILSLSARRNDPFHPDWTQNGAGYWINHDYGFGVIDASAAVNLALIWNNTGTEKTHTQSGSPNLSIPDDSLDGVNDTMLVSASSIDTIEFVELIFSASDHSFSGDLEITLTNKSTGTISRLSQTHSCPNLSCTAYNSWIFGSTRHLGEAADGEWTLNVSDRSPIDTGTFQSWSLKFYGQ